MPLLPRKNIVGLEPYQHGGPDYAELERLGISSDEIIDFSSNLNPRGFPPGIRPLVKSTRLSRYPDSRCTALRRMIARKTGLSEDNVIAGNGSTELIRLTAAAYLDKSDKALIIEPTYGEYCTACRIAGAGVISRTLSAEDNFRLDADVIVRIIKDARPKAVFICNPNNPTGAYLDRSGFEKIMAAAPDSLIVLDEAYIFFASHSWPSVELLDKGNLLIVRSMTKDYSLAGLRLGYALGNREIIETLSRICPSWNVNAVAQHAGIVALQQEKYLEDSRRLVYEGKRYLIEELEKLGLHCLPSEANFFLVRVGNAAELRNRLLSKKILVRDCASFGLPDYIRISPRTMKKNRKIINALREISAGGSVLI